MNYFQRCMKRIEEAKEYTIEYNGLHDEYSTDCGLSIKKYHPVSKTQSIFLVRFKSANITELTQEEREKLFKAIKDRYELQSEKKRLQALEEL